MTDIEARPPWFQNSSESDQQYAWFQGYCAIGDARTPAKAARRQGVPLKQIEEAAARHDWVSRCAHWERDSLAVARERINGEEEALALQHQTGMVMLHMGLTGLQAKNPALLDMKTIMALLTQGAEHVRRGAGVADMKINHETKTQIRDVFAEFLGEA